MNVYVETNFILELAFMQEQHESCGKILALCKDGSHELILPSFCIAESYETLIRQTKKREQLARDLASELRQLTRAEPDEVKIEAFQNASSILVQSSNDEELRLVDVLNRVLKIATIIPLEAETIVASARYRVTYSLEPQDSIVLSSVLHHLSLTDSAESCFINKNKRDFDDFDIGQSLVAMRCKMLFNFDSGYNYIRK